MLVLKPISIAAVAFLSPLLFDGVQGRGSATSHAPQNQTGFPPCDALLATNLSHTVHMPSSPLYSFLVNNGSYAIDTSKQPWCFVLPTTAEEVSETITAIRSAGDGAGDWHVAIRSGGHGNGNQNNVEQGVIINLTQLNRTTYDAETNIASIGTGARWGEVYAELEEHGVLVTGGREAVVGVGGLLLGGGISWYAARYGFSCDTIVNFEAVLANGRIINANATAHPDLFKALKGGSSNFGIVTRFDMEAFPAENLYIERKIMSREQGDKIIDGVVGFTNLDQSFKDNALIAIMTYDPKQERSIVTLTTINTKNDSNTTAFDGFKSIPSLAPITKESQSLSQSSNRTQLSGQYQSAGAGSLLVVNDPKVIRYAYDQYDGLVEEMKILLGPKNFTTILDLQPFQSYMSSYGVEKGGNMLGLEHDTRNKILLVFGVTLTGSNSEELYPRVYQIVAATNKRIEDFAERVGSLSKLRYLPYSDPRQNVLESYGEANVKHIKETANKYDPDGFFQEMVPGGFKISRVR
ncbi:fad binding domain-containing protein [Fusarium avenaceum]|nr:fad binding domain-containing protein [Fusarium avenaceum]